MARLRRRRWRFARLDRLGDTPLDRQNPGIPKRCDHRLECMMARGIERPRQAQSVAGRMRRIKMRARYPPRRNRLGGGMGAAAFQETRQDVGMRPFRALSRCRRDRLIDFDPAEPAEEDAMRIGVQDESHRGIAGLEHGRPACWQLRGDVSCRQCGRKNRLAARRGRDRTAGRHGLPRAMRLVSSDLGSSMRPFIAQLSFGRHSAIRWFHPDLVMPSEAKGGSRDRGEWQCRRAP